MAIFYSGLLLELVRRSEVYLKEYVTVTAFLGVLYLYEYNETYLYISHLYLHDNILYTKIGLNLIHHNI